MSDWIDLVESAYDLAPTADLWLQGLLDHAAPLLDHGSGANAQLFHVTPTRFSLHQLALRGAGTVDQLRGFLEAIPPEGIDLIYRRGSQVGSLSEWMFPTAKRWADRFQRDTPQHFQDAVGLLAYGDDGLGVVLNAPLPRPAVMGRRARSSWTRVIAHLCAALRMRQKLARLDLDSSHVEAIFAADGTLAHASENGKSRTAQARLREAVGAAERARSAQSRHRPDEALALWQALVSGRWSLLEHFDTDQRRFVVAIKNDPGVRDPRGLTAREHQVAELYGMKRNTKEIAYVLGLSTSTVGNTLTRVARKLALSSRTEVAALFEPNGIRARLCEMDLLGERIVFGAYPLADADRFAGLTGAERDVVLWLLKGATYYAAAQHRGVSERTIANQAQSIYRKLGVRSRVELATV